MSELIRELRQAENDLMLARGALTRAAAHSEGVEQESLRFILSLVDQVGRRVAVLRKGNKGHD